MDNAERKREESAALKRELAQFFGTEKWYRHPLRQAMLYTDGVQCFAEKAGAYWFLDIVATEIFSLLEKEEFMVVTLDSAETGTAVIRVTDGNNHALMEKDIPWTDCPAGQWEFYLTNNVLLLPGEN